MMDYSKFEKSLKHLEAQPRVLIRLTGNGKRRGAKAQRTPRK